MKKVSCYAVTLWCSGALLCSALPLFATPSGLNNIPTADTIGEREVAVQAFDSFGKTRQHDLSAGFKTGLDLSPVRIELGLDGNVLPNTSGPGYAQKKAAIQPWDDAKLALGVANLAVSDFSRASDPFSYAVLTQDLNIFRASAGYGIQTRNNTGLLGIDRSRKINDRDFNLNADLIQTNDQTKWLPSVGAKYELSKAIILERWCNFTESGPPSFLAKLNYFFKF